MLVLTRKENQRVMIGDDVTVTVLAIQGGRVKLGVDAPAETIIDREEVFRDKLKNGERQHAGRHT